MKQVTISKKQENKGAKGILDLTGMLSQVLKQFEGIYSRVLPETDGLTVESWMEAHGVPRFTKVTVNADGTPKITKKGYTPTLINGGWADEMLAINDEGKVMANYIYKPVAGKVQTDDEGAVFSRVYASEEDALSDEGKPISIYKQVEVPQNRWSVLTILKGLIQSGEYGKHKEKADKSMCEWEKLEHVYIVIKGEDGVRRAIEVSKDRVQF